MADNLGGQEPLERLRRNGLAIARNYELADAALDIMQQVALGEIDDQSVAEKIRWLLETEFCLGEGDAAALAIAGTREHLSQKAWDIYNRYE